MRLVHAAALTAAALLLASVASAQGLGDAAAREREKRKDVPAKPTKVYTENDIGRSMPPVESTADVPPTTGEAGAGGAAGAAGAQPAADGQAPAEGAAPAGGEQPAEGAALAPDAAKAAADAEKAEQEAREKAIADWRKRLDQARKEEAIYKDIIDRLQLELNDISGGLYNPGRAAKISFQEENKQKLAQTQGRIATIEEEGRRNRYQ